MIQRGRTANPWVFYMTGDCPNISPSLVCYKPFVPVESHLLETLNEPFEAFTFIFP